MSAAGLYTSPAAAPNPASVTIRATSAADSAKSGQATVTVGAPAAPPPAITSVTPPSIPAGAFTINVNGTGFTAASLVLFGNKVLPTTFVNGNQLTAAGTALIMQQGTVNVVVYNPGNTPSAPFAEQVTGNAVVPYSSAFRFLEQATFGPTPADVSHVMQTGFQGYLTGQFATPMSPFTDPTVNFSGYTDMLNRFYTNAAMGQDQVRQRVGFAYSQIFVISISSLFYQGKMIPYYNKLYGNAFGNFASSSKIVTLSPAMGEYLNMVNPLHR